MLSIVLSAGAGTDAFAADACAPAAGDATVAVAAVADTLDVRLEDGRLLRLAGLDVRPANAAAARSSLQGWAGGGPVTLHALSSTPDRWGRLPALLFRTTSPEPSAAAALLVRGLARARPEVGLHPCFADFLAAEDRARTAGLGVWADPDAAAIRADDVVGLARASGGFAEVEGILRVHAARGGTRYLSLGRDRWGFTAVLTRRDAARLAKEGLDVADYAGAPVRLRGDLDDRFGARIRLTDPDQIESLEPGALDARAASGR